ncbi:hypothetical protein Q8F55_006608 [Vanrija albida]|uniref:Uncharacterized protein n=1 Tax=Vanrija albida TaxID=181172 RepID=A0ABR3PXY4_9TREE
MPALAKFIAIVLVALALVACAAPYDARSQAGLAKRQDSSADSADTTDTTDTTPAEAAADIPDSTIDVNGKAVDSGVVPAVLGPDFNATTIGLNLPPGTINTNPSFTVVRPSLPPAVASPTSSAPASTTTTSTVAASPSPVPSLIAEPSKKSGARASVWPSSSAAAAAALAVVVCAAVWV